MALRYPQKASNDLLKLAFLYIAERELTQEYNNVGTWRREGATQQQYNRLSQATRDEFPYVAQLSDADFKRFRALYHNARQHLSFHMGKKKNQVAGNDFFDPVDISGLLEEMKNERPSDPDDIMEP